MAESDLRREEEPAEKRYETVPAGPWSRYFARQIDFLLFGFLVWSVIFGLFRGEGPVPFLGDRAIDAFLMVPLALFIEVPVYAAFGWTPGKWVFGITVRKADGSRLDFGEVLRRNLLLWPFGFGLGLPIVNLYFLVRNLFIARDGKRCRWDEKARYEVRQRPIKRLHMAGGIGLAVFLSVALSIVGGLYGDPFRLMGGHSVTWVNPLTNVGALLVTGWHPLEEAGAGEAGKGEAGAFRFQNASSFILLGREEFSGDLRAYADHLEGGDELGVLEGKKLQRDAQGYTSYVLSFHKGFNPHLPVQKPVRIDVKVWQAAPGSYWRILAYTPLDNDKERLDVRLLAESLERSTIGHASVTGAAPAAR